MSCSIRVKGFSLSPEKKKALLSDIHKQLELHQLDQANLFLNLKLKKGKMTVKMLLRNHLGSYHSKVTDQSLAIAMEKCYLAIEKQMMRNEKKVHDRKIRQSYQKKKFVENFEIDSNQEIEAENQNVVNLQKVRDQKKKEKKEKVQKKATNRQAS